MTDEQFELWLDELKSVDMQDVCDAFGIETKRANNRTQCICPYHNDTNFGSCYITKDNHLHCFACSTHADTIGLVQHMTKKSFWDSCLTLSQIGNIAVPQQAPASPEEDENQMPFSEEKEICQKQLDLLGLQKSVSAFIPQKYTDNPVDRSKYAGAFVCEENGYILGKYVKHSLYKLFTEDEEAFHHMVMGKLFYTLIDLMCQYETEHFATYASQSIVEESIELLLPIVEYYRMFSSIYGYNFDFVDMYKRHGFSSKTGRCA